MANPPPKPKYRKNTNNIRKTPNFVYFSYFFCISVLEEDLGFISGGVFWGSEGFVFCMGDLWSQENIWNGHSSQHVKPLWSRLSGGATDSEPFQPDLPLRPRPLRRPAPRPDSDLISTRLGLCWVRAASGPFFENNFPPPGGFKMGFCQCPEMGPKAGVLTHFHPLLHPNAHFLIYHIYIYTLLNPFQATDKNQA